MIPNQGDIDENDDSRIAKFVNEMKAFGITNNLANSTQSTNSRHFHNSPAASFGSSGPSSNHNLTSVNSNQFDYLSSDVDDTQPRQFSQKKRGRKPQPKSEQLYSSSSSISSTSGTRIRSRSSNFSESSISSRSRSRSSLHESNNSDNENTNQGNTMSYEEDDNEMEDNSVTEGNIDKIMPIEEILCIARTNFGPLDENNPDFDIAEPQYLVKLDDEAPVHSLLVTERSMKYGPQLPRLLSEFKKSCAHNQLKVSSVDIDFLEPNIVRHSVNINTFEIEQIIGHRSFEPEMKFIEKLLGQSNHVPGLPTESFLPNFEEMLKFQSSFSSSPEEAFSLLRNDGFLSTEASQSNTQYLYNESAFPQQKVESEDEESTDDSDISIPKKVEFKIQWKNLPASQCTWETEETLRNLISKQNQLNFVVRQNLFCPTNIDDFDNLAHKYWLRVVNLSEKNITLTSQTTKEEVILIDAVPEVIPTMERGTLLFNIQEDIIKQLFMQKIQHINGESNGLCQVTQIKNSGRIFALVSFLQMLYLTYHTTRPSMIIVDDENSYIWKDALTTISSLYWFEFTGNSSNRTVLKHYRFDTKTRFDVLITNHQILKKECEFLGSFDWDTIIVDDIHSDIEKCKESEPESIFRRNRQKKSVKTFEEDNEIDDQTEFNSISSILFKTNLVNKPRPPFVILLNDIEEIPMFNQMSLDYKVNLSRAGEKPSGDEMPIFTPFHYTEEILLVPNLLSEFVFKKLSTLFKKRAARVLNMSKALDVVNECALLLQHPSIIPEIHREAFNRFKEDIGFAAPQLPRNEAKRKEILNKMELDFLRGACGKFNALDELIMGAHEKFPSITAIVAEDLTILKLLRSYLLMLNVPVGIINTNCPEEKVPDDFEYGVLLMNRDISHEQIDEFIIKQIIFYDVSTSYKKDLNFIQFVSRPRLFDGEIIFPDIDVYRILTRHSIEIELFMKTTMNPNEDGVPSFYDYKLSSKIRTIESILRALVLQTRDAEDEREKLMNDGKSDPYQLHGQQGPSEEVRRKFNAITSFKFEFPVDHDELKTHLNSILDEIDVEDFWSDAFISKNQEDSELTSIDFMNYVYNEGNEVEESETGKNENETSEVQQEESEKEIESNQPPEYHLYIELLKHGLDNWELISNILNMPFEDVQAIGKGMVLKMLANIDVTEIHHYTLASNIYWFEYSGTFAAGHQLDEADIWRRFFNNKKLSQIPSSIFKNECFLIKNSQQMATQKPPTVFDSPYAERNLRYFEENYIVRVFLAFRRQPYLPPRFFAKKGSVMHTPAFIYAFLNFYANNTGDWTAIKRKFNLTKYSTEAVISYFSELYDAIFSDLYSLVIHEIYSGGRIQLIETNPIICPLVQVLEQGPFILNWYEDEIKKLTDTLILYSIPLTSEGMEDWCEFHSLTQLLTKSTENIEFMTSFIIEGIKPLTENQKFTILPDFSMGNQITVSQPTVKKLKNRLSFLSIVQKLARRPQLDHFRPQVDLPEGWTVEEDLTLLQGICQFGYGKLMDLGKLNINFYQDSQNCPIMTKDLSKFSPFISEKHAILKRLKLILISNTDINPTDSKQFDDIFGDTSANPNQIKKGRPPIPKKPAAPRIVKHAPPKKPSAKETNTTNVSEIESDNPENAEILSEPKSKEVQSKPKKIVAPKSNKPKIEYVYDKEDFDDDVEENDDDDEFNDNYGEDEEDSRYSSNKLSPRSRKSFRDQDEMQIKHRMNKRRGKERYDSDYESEEYEKNSYEMKRKLQEKKKERISDTNPETIPTEPFPLQGPKITFVFHPIPQKIIFRSG